MSMMLIFSPQMKHAVQAALRKEGTSTGERATEWWTHLCANKHLKENSNLKRVRLARAPPQSFTRYHHYVRGYRGIC